MPRDLWRKKKLQADLADGKKKVLAQGTLDTVVTKCDFPQNFDPHRTLVAIAQYLVTKDVVSRPPFLNLSSRTHQSALAFVPC